MKKCYSLMLLLALSAGSFESHAVPILYVLTTITDGTNTLNGSITVNDNGDNNVAASEITAWSFVSSGPVSFSINQSSPNHTILCFGSSGCFSIVGQSLQFDFGSTLSAQPNTQFEATDSNSHLQRVLFLNDVDCGAPIGSGCIVVANVNGDHSFPISGLSTVAIVPPASVPEPSILALMGIALAAAVCVRASRRRKQQRPAV